jgi:hypothetical protein
MTVIRGPVPVTAEEYSVLRKYGAGDMLAWAAELAIAAAAEPVRRASAVKSGGALSRALGRWAASLAYVLHRALDVLLPVAQLRGQAIWRRGPPRLAAAPGVLVTDP